MAVCPGARVRVENDDQDGSRRGAWRKTVDQTRRIVECFARILGTKSCDLVFPLDVVRSVQCIRFTSGSECLMCELKIRQGVARQSTVGQINADQAGR